MEHEVPSSMSLILSKIFSLRDTFRDVVEWEDNNDISMFISKKIYNLLGGSVCVQQSDV